MRLNTLIAATAALSLGIAGAAAAQAPTPAAPATAAPAAAGDLTMTLRNAGQFTTFLRLLNSVNLTGLVRTQPGLTVFAPTDAAFAAMPAGELDALSANKPALQKRLMHHLINARIAGANIKGAKSDLPTGAADMMTVDGTGAVLKADNATIVQTDLAASNGVIHVVDQVLKPGSVPPAGAPDAASAPAAAAPAAAAGPG